MPETHLLYGPTDVGKTAQLRNYATWEYSRTGRISRAFIADSTIDPLKDLIITPENPNGIVEVFELRGMDDPWKGLGAHGARGFWPKRQEKSTGGYNIIWDPMKLQLGADGRKRIISTDGKREVGQYFIEGLDSIASLMLHDHANHADTRLMWGSGKDGPAMFTSDALVGTGDSKPPTKVTEKIGRAVGGHYGSVQSWLKDVLIPNFSELIYVDRVVWTAHADRGKDPFTGMEGKALGPKSVGNALVGETTELFGHSFHFEVETKFDKDSKVTRVFKAWFITHPDDLLTTMKWPAKVSLPVERAVELLKKFPQGYIPLESNKGMEQWLDFLHPSLASARSMEVGGK
jgi:hypothetical protein